MGFLGQRNLPKVVNLAELVAVVTFELESGHTVHEEALVASGRRLSDHADVAQRYLMQSTLPAGVLNFGHRLELCSYNHLRDREQYQNEEDHGHILHELEEQHHTGAEFSQIGVLAPPHAA
jgi:hypothetical protein